TPARTKATPTGPTPSTAVAGGPAPHDAFDRSIRLAGGGASPRIGGGRREALAREPAYRPAVESRARDQALAPAGPERQAHLGLLAAGLHAKPRERRVARRPAAGLGEQARDAPPVGRAQVLHHDGVEDDARHTRGRRGEACGEPRGRAGGVDRGRDPARYLERAAQERDPFALVGPQVGEERELPVGRAGVEGQRVAAAALDHAEAATAGREAIRKHVEQAHRRGTVAPA